MPTGSVSDVIYHLGASGVQISEIQLREPP